MRGVVCAVAIGRLPDGTLVVDPDEEEEESLRGGGCFAFMFADKTGLDKDDTSASDCVWSGWTSMSGSYDEGELFRARELARATALDVYVAMKNSIHTLDSRLSYNTSTPAQNLVKATKDEMKVGDDSDDDRMEI